MTRLGACLKELVYDPVCVFVEAARLRELVPVAFPPDVHVSSQFIQKLRWASPFPRDGEATIYEQSLTERKRAKSYQMTFGDEESQKNLSSVTHVAKGKNIPPFLILHVADHPETKAQSQRLVKVLQEAGISARAYPAEGKNHTTINNDLGIADDRPTQEMFGFLSAVLKK